MVSVEDDVTRHESGAASGRAMYLLGGRRVTLTDLLEAGLLQPGSKLRFMRKRIGTTHHASVTKDGRIRLEPDGREFRSPSRAAMVAARMPAVDGWRAWQVVEQNKLLDALRQELLDRAIAAAAAAATEQNDRAEQQRIHERLKQARQRAENGDPERISVRELLSLWGATDRGDHIAQIEVDLANHGLVTNPSFRAVTLDTTVALATPRDEADEGEAADAPQSGGSDDVEELPANDDDEDVAPLNVGLTVGNISPLTGVEHVSPNATMEEAITKMLLNDYSQLAVLSGSRTLRGAVTWRSIAQAQRKDPAAGLPDAVEPHVEAVAYDRELIDVLPVLLQRGFIFVRDETNQVAGIVTTADVAHRYGEMATPFLQLGELDQTLRWIVNRVCDLDTVREVCKRQVDSFDELTVGEYQRLLANKEVWKKLGWPLDRATLISRLDEIRDIRNRVMHFHPDPLPKDAVDKVRWFNNLLHSYRHSA